MNNLQLSLKKQWFEMTKSRIKTEDYREITLYWYYRLIVPSNNYTREIMIDDYNYGIKHKERLPNYFGESLIYNFNNINYRDQSFKNFTTNTMTLGYPKSTDAERIIKFEHAGIEIRTGNPEWGAEANKLYFVIKHGKLINF